MVVPFGGSRSSASSSVPIKAKKFFLQICPETHFSGQYQHKPKRLRSAFSSDERRTIGSLEKSRVWLPVGGAEIDFELSMAEDAFNGEGAEVCVSRPC